MTDGELLLLLVMLILWVILAGIAISANIAIRRRGIPSCPNPPAPPPPVESHECTELERAVATIGAYIDYTSGMEGIGDQAREDVFEAFKLLAMEHCRKEGGT